MDKNKFKDNVKTIELYDVDNVIDFITTELNINKEKYAIFFCDIISCGYNTSTIDYEKAACNINKKIKCIECDCLYDNFDNYIDYEQAERLYNFIENNIGYFINNKVKIKCVDLYSLNEFEVVVDEDDKDNTITMLKNNNSILSIEYVNNSNVTGGKIDDKKYIVGVDNYGNPLFSKSFLNVNNFLTVRTHKRFNDRE